MTARTHAHEFKRAVRRAVIQRAAGKCEACGAVLKLREGEVDHILPVALGGEPAAENARLICSPCHKAKTAEDIGRIRKADRQRDKQTGAIRPTRPLTGKPFTPAGSAITREQRRAFQAAQASLRKDFVRSGLFVPENPQ